MPVLRYRSVGEMAPPWRAAHDPGNLGVVGAMLRFHRRHAAIKELPRGVHRYRTIEALNEERGDPYRRAPTAGSVAAKARKEP